MWLVFLCSSFFGGSEVSNFNVFGLLVFSFTADAFCVLFKKFFLSFEPDGARTVGAWSDVLRAFCFGTWVALLPQRGGQILLRLRPGWAGEGEATPGVLLLWLPIFQEELS